MWEGRPWIFFSADPLKTGIAVLFHSLDQFALSLIDGKAQGAESTSIRQKYGKSQGQREGGHGVMLDPFKSFGLFQRGAGTKKGKGHMEIFVMKPRQQVR
jgi:hypothetical protein